MKAYRTWEFIYPMDAHPMSVTFDEPMTEREFRTWCRKSDGVKRLPRGFDCGPVPTLDELKRRNSKRD